MLERTLLLSLLVLAPLAPGAQAQCSGLFADINQNGDPLSSTPMGMAAQPGHKNGDSAFVQMGPYWYFQAFTLATGYELFRTDGTPSGTQLVSDIVPGDGSSSPSGLVVFQGQLFFAARTDATGKELWKTDGTALGTVMVAEVWPGTASGVEDRLAVLGNQLLFPGNDGGSGSELWSSDGTSAGTQRVKNIAPGSASSWPSELTVDASGSTLLFFANDGLHGNELWKSDGTPAGTQLVLDMNPGSTSTMTSGIHVAAGLAFFAANVGLSGMELWTTDGTGSGTALLMDFDPASGESGLTAYEFTTHTTEFGGKLYFSVSQSSISRGLWVSDGTPSGTLPIFADTGETTQGARFMTASGGTLYLTVWSAISGGELWKLVGNKISLVADLVPGNGSGLEGDELLPFGSGVLFMGSVPSVGLEPCVSDGTAAGTGLLKDIMPGSKNSLPREFTLISPSKALFAASSSTVGRELWVTDGTMAGTSLFLDLEPLVVTDGSSAGQLHGVAGQTLFFSASDGTSGTEPWVWDAANGATLLADANPGIWSSSPSDFTSAWIGGQIETFFIAGSFSTGKELWRSDGTPAGTNLVIDLVAGPGDGVADELISFDGAVFFLGGGGGAPRGLWRSDGTAAGTTLVKALSGNFPASAGRHFAYFQDQLYFAANDVAHGNELWRTDGTTVGTQLVADLDPAGSSAPSHLIEVAGKLAFTAKTPASGTEVWTTDGTSGGTQLLIDANPGPASSEPDELVVMQGELFFVAKRVTSGRELWSSDLVTTQQLIDIVPGSGSGSPASLIAANGRLYFSAIDAVHGRELWSSDGTASGTALVADLRAGPSSAMTAWYSPDRPLFTPASGGIYFTAKDGVHGEELFFSDGTAAGTTLVCDLDPGSASGRPLQLTYVGGHLFAQAANGVVGMELFEIFDSRALAVDLELASDGFQIRTGSPALGSLLDVEGVQVPASTPGFLLVSTPAAASAPAFLQPGSVSWIDLASFWIVDTYATAVIDSQLPIPADPLLVGLELDLQAWFLPGGILPARTSNGVRLVFGS